MKRSPQNFLISIAFLTRIPVAHGPVGSIAGLTSWFPVTGALIGSITASVWILASSLVSPLSASVLAMLTAVCITGAFHHDGLADAMDGLVGGWTSDQRLSILKDSRHGTYGVMALVLQVALQVSLLSELPVKTGAVALVVIHSLGRTSAVWMMKSGRGLKEGMGANYVAEVRWAHLGIATVWCSVIVVLLLGVIGIVVMATVAMAAYIFSHWARRKIGGIVGDVLGAIEQVGESIALIVLVILHRHDFLIPWW